MAEEVLLMEREECICMLSINRPERRNAINQELLIHLYNRLDEVSGSDDIYVAIITGKGKSFCSGLDLDVLGTDNYLIQHGDGAERAAAGVDCVFGGFSVV